MEAMSSEDLKWQTESDARTLKEAELIRADEKRLPAAMELMDKEISAMVQASAKNRYPYMEKGG